MKCPYCAKELAKTAIRCKFCRKNIKGSSGSLLDSALKRAADLFFGGRDQRACSWSFLDIILFTQLILLFIFYDPFNLGREIADYLRLNFSMFTKEPKLLFYLTVYIKSILLYVVSFSLVVILVKVRGASFWRSVISGKERKHSLLKWLPLYVMLCILLRAVGARNPLIPNIPFDSVFQEARILGNSVIILTTLFFAPFIEEIIFRGFLYPAFNRYLGILPSILFTSTLFT
ncbi:MAG: CPBP family intramembrane glutamic endopeptidase, partial [Candidatus Omnitrophota bacterium]